MSTDMTNKKKKNEIVDENKDQDELDTMQANEQKYDLYDAYNVCYDSIYSTTWISVILVYQ